MATRRRTSRHNIELVQLLFLLLSISVLFCLLITRHHGVHCAGDFSIHPHTKQIIDSDGREIYFHGVNEFLGHIVQPDRLTKRDIERTMALGLNVIRLAVDWHGFEPVRGQYNMEYVNLIHKLLQQMDQLGVYAILDAHQDCLSPKFCGDGVPDWAANPRPNAAPFPAPIDKPYTLDNVTGYPSKSDCSKHYWGFYCMSEAGASAIQNFYDNYDGALDSFANWWQFMAKEFRNYTNLIGYEILNEPFPGDVYMKPSLLFPGTADAVNLMPMYHKISAAIRRSDPNALIFFEPVTWSNFGTHFESVPGGEKYRNRSVLSYHFYVPPNTLPPHYFPMRLNDSARLGCGNMLTEFDVIDTSDENLKQVVDTISVCNQHRVSWIGWAYRGYLDNPKVTSLLSQTYAMAVAGSLISQSFTVRKPHQGYNEDDATAYKLAFKLSTRCKLPTIIYLNEDVHYPNGYIVQLTPGNIAKWMQYKRNYIHVYTAGNAKDNEIVELTIRATSNKHRSNKQINKNDR